LISGITKRDPNVYLSIVVLKHALTLNRDVSPRHKNTYMCIAKTKTHEIIFRMIIWGHGSKYHREI
jgi:hypothetical protein